MAELFEARRPKDPATISEIDGVVRFGDIKRGKREIFVAPMNARRQSLDETQEAQLYEVAAGKHLRVHEGDRVRAGDRLSEGPVNPHDILRIKGPRAVQEYLLNEVQEVYRLQGVKINDKHIGVIVRQMLQKVRIMESGRHRVPRRRARGQAGLPRRERAGEEEEADAGDGRAAAARHHEGVSSRRSRSSRRRRSRRPRACSPTRRSAARRDDLLGLKENIIIGHLIPAGTGMYRYQEVEIDIEPPPQPTLSALPDPLMGGLLPPLTEAPVTAGFEDDDDL